MAIVQNPILRGFNPDPCICRAGDDYYIATSTFEWFPGVQIHHSRDLVHWELITHPLNRVSQLDMAGVPDSCGIWAPCLTWDGSRFWLIYTVVRNAGPLKDTPNYLVTAEDIRGPWSDPVYLNSSGFDPSLFHDDDGRKWLVNMKWDTRAGKNRFAGHLLQEYDVAAQRLTGPIVNICPGTELGCSEGPHLYKRNGWYYLMMAEGGTGYKHAVSLARARHITGPYEFHPENPVVTSVGSDMHATLQKAGHASITEDAEGNTWLVHLCGRPLPGTNRCILGRETALQRVVWRDDDWLYLAAPSAPHPAWTVEIPGCSALQDGPVTQFDHFDASELNLHFQTLRIPGDGWLSLTDRPGYLRLYGQESMLSPFRQSFVARRQQSFVYTAETVVTFSPEDSIQMAGLICYYNTRNFHYLRICGDEATGGAWLGVLSCIQSDMTMSMHHDDNVPVTPGQPLWLRACMDHSDLRFFWSTDGQTWQAVGGVLDASILSDDAITGSPAFTGAFVGMCCQDLSGRRNHADFDCFSYTEASREPEI